MSDAAPKTRVRRVAWRPYGRYILFVAWIVLLLILIYGKWGSRIRAILANRTAEANCENFAAPATRIVFEGDPTKAKALVGGGGYRAGAGAIWTEYEQALKAAVDARGRLESFKSRGQPGSWPSAGAPFTWPDDLNRMPFPSPEIEIRPGQNIPIFLHRRKAGGVWHIVLVCLSVEGSGTGLSLSARVRPVSAVGRPAADFSPTHGDPALGQWKDVPLSQVRFFAGQSDPDDPSKFTVDYEWKNQRGRVQGQLMKDGSVNFLWSGPLARDLFNPHLAHGYAADSW